MYNEARAAPQVFFFLIYLILFLLFKNWHLSVVGPLSTHFFDLLKKIIYLFVAFYKYSYILVVNQKKKLIKFQKCSLDNFFTCNEHNIIIIIMKILKRIKKNSEKFS